MSLPYLDLATFKTRTFMAAGEVDYVESDSACFIAGRIAIRTSWIHSRLRKRYGASLPFSEPVPEIILNWITALVTLDAMRKRGMNPQDPAAELMREDATRAEAEVKEAADSKDGLFDLPSPEEGGSNVTTGGPLGYSETSPYVSAVRERTQGRAEDGTGTGTGDVS